MQDAWHNVKKTLTQKDRVNQMALVRLWALLVVVCPLSLAAIITTCSNDTSAWATCVRSETDGIVFFPKSRLGAWSQHFYEIKFRVRCRYGARL